MHEFAGYYGGIGLLSSMQQCGQMLIRQFLDHQQILLLAENMQDFTLSSTNSSVEMLMELNLK